MPANCVLILAAGLSKRFGDNKLLQYFRGRRLLFGSLGGACPEGAIAGPAAECLKDGKATIKAGIAFIKGKFKTRILISDDSNEENVKINGNGTGSNSSLSFTVYIKFDESGTGCTISYDADVSVAGNAATMGQRVIEKAERDYVEKIIGNYKKSFR